VCPFNKIKTIFSVAHYNEGEAVCKVTYMDSNELLMQILDELNPKNLDIVDFILYTCPFGQVKD